LFAYWYCNHPSSILAVGTKYCPCFKLFPSFFSYRLSRSPLRFFDHPRPLSWPELRKGLDLFSSNLFLNGFPPPHSFSEDGIRMEGKRFFYFIPLWKEFSPRPKLRNLIFSSGLPPPLSLIERFFVYYNPRVSPPSEKHDVIPPSPEVVARPPSSSDPVFLFRGELSPPWLADSFLI